MQLIVLTLNMNYDRKHKAILSQADISKRYFSVYHLKIVFHFLNELKQRSRSSDVTERHERPVDSDVTEGVITTRSNRMKFRLKHTPIVQRKQKTEQCQASFKIQFSRIHSADIHSMLALI